MIAFVALGETPKIGERAPQFSLPAATGSTVSLSDYAGKSKLVVVFYRGYW
jgi:peroxiredoxin